MISKNSVHTLEDMRCVSINTTDLLLLVKEIWMFIRRITWNPWKSCGRKLELVLHIIATVLWRVLTTDTIMIVQRYGLLFEDCNKFDSQKVCELFIHYTNIMLEIAHCLGCKHIWYTLRFANLFYLRYERKLTLSDPPVELLRMVWESPYSGGQ